MNKDQFVNHSGGAIGSDSQWDQIGRSYGFKNHRHYWSNNKTPIGNFEISKEDEIEGQIKATLAARQLGRIGETHQVRDERIIRNWCQVKYSEVVYAIGNIMNAGETMNYGKIAKIIQVSGGTGYAVQMAANENKKVYFFDQLSKRWYLYSNHSWSVSAPPALSLQYAGIGTRQITDAGKNAIKEVFENTSKYVQE